MFVLMLTRCFALRTNSLRKAKSKSQSQVWSIVALILSILLPPVGLILAFYARSKEGKNTLNLIALILGLILTILIAVGIVWGIVAFWVPFW